MNEMAKPTVVRDVPRLCRIAFFLVACAVVVVGVRNVMGTCTDGCWDSTDKHYNNWYNDYHTSKVICIDYARDTKPDNKPTYRCGKLVTMTRRTLANAVRYCGAIGRRGENQPITDTVFEEEIAEPTLCFPGTT